MSRTWTKLARLRLPLQPDSFLWRLTQAREHVRQSHRGQRYFDTFLAQTPHVGGSLSDALRLRFDGMLARLGPGGRAPRIFLVDLINPRKAEILEKNI